jgi:hypothetical protein
MACQLLYFSLELYEKVRPLFNAPLFFADGDGLRERTVGQ